MPAASVAAGTRLGVIEGGNRASAPRSSHALAVGRCLTVRGCRT